MKDWKRRPRSLKQTRKRRDNVYSWESIIKSNEIVNEREKEDT